MEDQPRHDHTHPVAALGSALLLLGLAAVPLSGQTNPGTDSAAPTPLVVEEVVDFEGLPSRNAPILSPDGSRLAYVVEGPKRTLGRVAPLLDEASGAWTEIRVVDLKSGRIERLGRSTWAPAWSPDGSTLAFLAAGTSDGEPMIELGVVEWTDAGPALDRFVTEGSAWAYWSWTRPRWTPDGASLVMKLVPAGESTAELLRRSVPALSEEASASERLHSEATVDLFRSDEVTARGGASEEGDGPAREGRGGLPEWVYSAYGGDLARIDLSTGEIRRLTNDAVTVSWRISPAGDQLAIFEPAGAEDGITMRYRISVVPLAGGAVRVVADTAFQTWARGMSWAPDGSALAYLSRGGEESSGAFVAPVDGSGPSRVAALDATWDVEVPPVWTPGGDALLVAGNDTLRAVPVDGSGVRGLATVPGHRLGDLVVPRATGRRLPAADGAVLLRVAALETGDPGFARISVVDGRVEAVSTEPGSFGNDDRSDVSADGSVVVSRYSTTRRAPELWALDRSLARDRQLSRINPGFEPSRLGDDRIVEWRGRDGRELGGTVLFPPGVDPEAEPERPLPVVVEVYGGNSGRAAKDVFSPTRQLLASHGFAVFVPDIPLEVGTPMRDHADAVLPGVDRLIELGIADPERIGVTGHSYGGYGTLALLVQSGRFAAAVASAAQGDLVANYGEMAPDGTDRMEWSERGQGRMGGMLWDVPERYIENSPIFRLDEVTAPLLLLHGAEDPTVPVWLAEAVFTGLRRLDRPVVLARYPGEGHWYGDWSVPNQIDYWSRLLDWFERYLSTEPMR